MRCEECGERPATVHITRIINNQKSQAHLCEECASKEHNQVGFGWNFLPAISLEKFVAGLLQHEFRQEEREGSLSLPERCEQCGQTFQEFSQTGRLGCGQCYQSFARRLEPLLHRVHGGVRHTGKVPRRTGGSLLKRQELEKLRSELQSLVIREEFEKAAQVRDRIRDLEKQAGDKAL